MKRKILTGLCLTPLMAAAVACSNTTESDPVTTETSTTTTTASETTTEVVVSEGRPEIATITTPAPIGPTTVPDPCEEDYGHWSTLEDSTDTQMVEGTIDMVRIGKHDCFDRIVVDVDTSEDVGFHAEYVPVVAHVGSGFPVNVTGEAVLQLVVDAPLAMTPNGMPAFETTPNWDVLQEVRSAGSFEGITKLAIGVSSEVKFGVFHHTDSDDKSHVVVDLIHPFE